MHARRHRIALTWIVRLAVLVGTFAPSLTHVMARGNGTVWVEVCSTAGTQLVAMQADEEPVGQPVHHAGGEHCPFCRLEADSPCLLTHLNIGATLALAAWALASTIDGLDLTGILR